jgi:benzoyl-CoA reductase/2-hydroxyglutaryl-CoA dehydratase subunit BcrC/BadD/HgdB
MNKDNISKVIAENTEQRRAQFRNFIALLGIGEEAGDNYIKSRFSGAAGDLKASHKRGRLLAEQFIRCYNKTPDCSEKYQLVAWRSLFMPTEIMYAMDIMPFTTEMAAAQLAMMGCQIRRMETAEENHFSQDLCSFIRTAVGAVIEDVFPTPDILITSSHLCDPSAKFGGYASIKYKRPEFVLDVPYGLFGGVYEEDYKRIEEGVDYLALQYKDLVRFITDNTGVEFCEKKLKQVIERSNRARQWLKLGNEFAYYRGTPAMKGSKDIDYAANLMQTWGTEEMVDVYRTRYEEFVQGADTGAPAPDKPRIHWYHLKPYYKNNLMSYIEEHAHIVSTMVNFMYWDEMDPDDPFRSLARRTLMMPGYCPVSVRAEITKKWIIEGDGIIAYYPKSCRHFHSSARIEMEIFKAANIPYLAIDGDCIDNRGDDFAIVQTRIDRFIKSMRKIKTGAA